MRSILGTVWSQSKPGNRLPILPVYPHKQTFQNPISASDSCK
jgi:hypothetical protein